ncbi:MAG: beta-ketoacyl synthase [Armatimonadota bacterium]
MSGRRVVITGLGLVTPLGLGAADFWSGLVAGRSAVGLVNLTADSGEPRQLAAPVTSFNARTYVADRKLLRIMSRTAQFGLAAAQMAVSDSGEAAVDPSRKGAFIGTGQGLCPGEFLFDAVRASRTDRGEVSATLLGSHGLSLIPPLSMLLAVPNGGLFACSVLHSIHGPNTNFLSSGEAALAAIGEAYWAIREGEADWALAGGYDGGVNRYVHADFHRLGMLSGRTDDPARAVRPFDRARDGFALGEGAGMVVLEEHGAAAARGAPVWAEILGFAASCDAAGPLTPRADGSALAAVMLGALRDAGVEPAEVDYVNAYGSATPAGDLTELRALERAFGGQRRRPLVSGIKGAIGHLLAAAGAVEFGATVLAVKHQLAPPTLNLDAPDPECHFDCVPNQARATPVKIALTVNRGIGGQNAAVVLRRAEGS